MQPAQLRSRTLAFARCVSPATKSLRSLSSSSSSSSSYAASAPPPATTSWERSARLVKNTTTNNQYLEHIRDLHDPSLHVKTIEDEIRGTMGKALGKQADKILRYVRLMQAEREAYAAALMRRRGRAATDAEHGDATYRPDGSDGEDEAIREAAVRHNEYREKAKTARWELIVHRQAVGFLVNNHQIVIEKFPIADALPVDGDQLGGSSSPSSPNDLQKKEPEDKKKLKFGTQLDWWQRVGRWR